MTEFFAARDALFAQGHWQERFRFDASVAAVFDDMALRSIPLYREALEATSQWVRRSLSPEGTVYDLGCSTGSGLAACMALLEPGHGSFVGVDSSPSMIERAQLKLTSFFPHHRWRLECGDLLGCDLSGAHAVLMGYTLQFVPVVERLGLLQRVHRALPPGGLLFVSDKLRVEGETSGPFMTEIYHRFKEDQGYSRLEIERKRRALEEVLVPQTLDEELALLRDAGFADVEVVLKWNQFVSVVALKGRP